MFTILFANFVVVLPVLLFVAGVVLVAKAPGAVWRRLGLLLIALPSGILAYIIASIGAAALRGDGHFYSVPLGGYGLTNNIAIGISVLLWIGAMFVVIAVVLRVKK